MERHFEDIERYAALFTKRGERFWVEGDVIFRIYQKMLVPAGAIRKNVTLSRKKCADLLAKSKGILIRQTTDFDCSSSHSDWYAVICEKFTPVDELKSKQRNEINRGLQNCNVRKITPKELADEGFECYSKAFENYKRVDVSVIEESNFRENILSAEGFEDLIHYWGVYHEDKMIAYASNYIYGNMEVAYTTIKLHPDYLDRYPMYALIYRMNEYYLKEHQFEYANDGFRSILHDTAVQEFLIKKFNFRRAYLKLNIQYHPLLGIIIKQTYPFRKIIAKFDARFNALFELERIHRKTKT